MKHTSTQTLYKLQSIATGRTFEDTGWLLEAPGENDPTLIRKIKKKQQLDADSHNPGLYKFADWLPVNRFLVGSVAPFTYKSKGLAAYLGLHNLYITFSGYWPEKGHLMPTCSFKETEAYSVCARLEPDNKKILVVASAGNTARAFAKVCSDNNIPLLLCVPEDYIDSLWFNHPIKENVKLISSRSSGDYYDAIHLSSIVARLDGFVAEGGAKNVARRDGMGTTVLSAVTTIGAIPDYYFQAVGSGTGAIAAWEANIRLIADGRFGDNKMKLMVSQNEPFTPIYDAWKSKSRKILDFDENEARLKVEIIDAKVLSNRKPPYSIIGGLYDALLDTDGDVLKADNQSAREAAALFEKHEGIDIHPAAAIATATLIAEVKDKKLDKEAVIMLNITGGGEKRFKNENELFYLKPEIIFDLNPNKNYVEEKVKRLF